MEHEGFLDTRKPQPLTLGLIIAGHVAVLTAIILSPAAKVFIDPFHPLTIENIPADQPPPPPMPLPRSHPKAQPHPNDVRPIVPTIGETTGPILQTELPPFVAPYTGPEVTITPVKTDKVFVSASIDPNAASRIQPDYPLQLVRADIEGSATVRVLIGTDGHVKQVEMVSATDPAFFDATRKQALRYWRFRPATSDGTPTESWRTMTVKFRLQS